MEWGHSAGRAGGKTSKRLPIGRHLVDSGAITPTQLVAALELQHSINAPLGEILVAEGLAKKQDVEQGLTQQSGIPTADFVNCPPNRSLCEVLPPRYWAKHRLLPWRGAPNEGVQVATERPDRFAQDISNLESVFGEVSPVRTTPEDLNDTIRKLFGDQLAIAANMRVARQFSCRDWPWSTRILLPLGLGVFATALSLYPTLSLYLLTLFALSTLFMFAALRISACMAHLSDNDLLVAPRPRVPAPDVIRKPKVSILVPLYREKEIVRTLIARLNRLTYPKAVLEVLLVLEEHDDVTRQTLSKATLPRWMRIIEVPAAGGITTKPRAMNYALDFCSGEIIGVWDAEDAPACDQIERVVERFATAPEEVVCLQGILDYYNPRTNWIARCFTIEYAAWFRVVLPGIARLGLIVPLGGTTLFFRRDKLEELGGWDAHNVTEDADLGVRLARFGYRTEMINTVTYEEANCRPWPWIKQRSRWLKGFMVTYLVHMRNPRQLWRDLGPLKFASFQAFFLGTLSQFLLAPVMWTFWLFLFGIPHPLEGVTSSEYLFAVMAFFFSIELTGIVIAMVAVSKSDRRFLMIWIPAMLLYFPLGTIAALKALTELIVAPYYWDKTQHGVEQADEEI